VKHLKELIKLLESDKQAEIWFLMMNKVKYFSINTKTQPQFEAVFYDFLKK
jgi:DNA-binding sugar fermentation-stimulating protein